MKNRYIGLFAAALLLSSGVEAQVKGDEDKDMTNKTKQRDQQAIDKAMNGWWKESMKTHEQRIQWWRDAKFGMFIHWGVYSLPGGEWKGKKVGGYAEHLMRKERITRAEYLELAHQFNPIHFDADKWVRDAKAAGMSYFIITAKHHDGFAMYNTKVSDFSLEKQTPFKRDPMAELAAACKKYGLKFGFYYSHAFDWEHPDAPGNDWEYKNPGGDQNLYGGRDWFDVHPELLPKAVKYVDEKAIPQIRELLLQYHPDIIWFDTPHKLPLSENIRILEAIRATDPNVVVNGRLVRTAAANFGDYKNTGDRPAEFAPVTGDWEAIPTTNESYGYSKFDDSHKPASFFIRLLAKAASRDGNLLLNIGPEGDGSFDQKDLDILKGIGAWTDKNRESIFKTHPSGLPLQSWGVTTKKDNRVYLHVFEWPSNGKLLVGGLNSVVKAYLLTDANKKTLPVQQYEGYLELTVPAKAADTSNTVIVMELDAKAKTADSTRYITDNTTTRLLAFDAALKGKGFSFGDGKSGSYYVEGWKDAAQTIIWTFKSVSPATYKVNIRYAASTESAGSYTLAVGAMTFKDQVGALSKGSNTILKEAGQVTLPAGTHTLTIVPGSITGKELMKLFEVQLVPVKK